MQMIKKLIVTTAVLCLAMGAAPLVSAAEANWYIGAGAGNSDPDVSGLDDDTGIKFLGGYYFTENFAVEGGFVDLGEFDVDFFPGASAEVDGFQIAGVGNWPVSQNVSVLGKFGLYLWDGEIDVLGFGFDDDGTDIMFGFGAQVGSGKWAVRGEWERFDIDGDDVDLLSFSILFRPNK